MDCPHCKLTGNIDREETENGKTYLVYKCRNKKCSHFMQDIGKEEKQD